jgi:type IV pilus assembly protein PilE
MSNGWGGILETQCPPEVRGFTLLELVIALAVVAILLALAVPAYQRYVQRGERAEAVRLLLSAAACQERVRAQGGYYDTSRCLEGVEASAYEFRIEPPDDSASLAFTVVAEPKQPRGDDPCGSLSLDQAGTRGISGAADSLAACWGGR